MKMAKNTVATLSKRCDCCRRKNKVRIVTTNDIKCQIFKRTDK